MTMYAVLIVDGHQEFRRATSAILQRSGYETLCAVDADHALKQLVRHHVSAAVIGATLTDTTGLALVRLIRRTSPALPVIVVTEHPSPEAARAYLDLGSRAYLSKAEFLQSGPNAVGRAVDTYGEASECTSSSPAVGA